jgi:hypothetical protein
VFGVAGAFGGHGEPPESSYWVAAARIAEGRVGCDSEQQSDRPCYTH